MFKNRLNAKTLSVAALAIGLTLGASAQKNKDVTNDQAMATMKKATQFMMDKASYQGGFVWNYLPDMSRTWGEMEAYRTMVWIQPPGTPTVGHLLLDAYHATGDEYYYQAAENVANALIWGQLPCGGWGYMFDYAGEGSAKNWFETIGKNGWRLEEFQHYYGNATFDDAGTAHAAKFLLRMYTEKNDPKYRPALDKCIDFMLVSQYPIGGWPQRFPLMDNFSKKGLPDYTPFITLNDAVNDENIEFLMQCYQALGTQNVIEPCLRAMYLLQTLKLGQPYPGWADQYTILLEPMGARTYEPKAINTSGSADNVRQLTEYYKMTGDTRFLSGIEETIDWLESLKLSDEEVAKSGKPIRPGVIMVPRWIDVNDGKPLYVHRTGSNIVNGYYFVDQNIENTIGHYSSQGFINVPELRKMYAEAKKLDPKELKANSQFYSKNHTPLEKYYTSSRGSRATNPDEIKQIVNSLTPEGYWLVPISYSNPYIGQGSPEATPGDYLKTNVGDKYDTSPYRPEVPVYGISTGDYVNKMFTLINFLDSKK